MTHAETTELPGAVPGRAAQIAAIYMFAHWLVEHPEVPMPEQIVASWYAKRCEGIDQAARYAAVAQLAADLGAVEHGSEHGDGHPQADYHVADPKTHGIKITYRMAAMSDGFYERSL